MQVAHLGHQRRHSGLFVPATCTLYTNSVCTSSPQVCVSLRPTVLCGDCVNSQIGANRQGVRRQLIRGKLSSWFSVYPTHPRGAKGGWVHRTTGPVASCTMYTPSLGVGRSVKYMCCMFREQRKLIYKTHSFVNNPTRRTEPGGGGGGHFTVSKA